MDCRKIKGLDALLTSLRVADPGNDREFARCTLYDGQIYKRADDIDVWYHRGGDELFKNTLPKVINQYLEKAGHLVGDSSINVHGYPIAKLFQGGRRADEPPVDPMVSAVILAFTLTLQGREPLSHFERLLSNVIEVDLEQFFLIPIIPGVNVRHPDDRVEFEIINFDLAQFTYAPLYADSFDRLCRRLKRTPGGDENINFLKEHHYYEGLCISREPWRVRVLDLDASGVRIPGSDLAAECLQYYFDDLGLLYFRQFWQEHRQAQWLRVAAGFPWLDSDILQSLPKVARLSVFWGVTVGKYSGLASIIWEDQDLLYQQATAHILNYQWHLRQPATRDKLLRESQPQGKVTIAYEVLLLARCMARSAELQLRAYWDEAFLQLIVGIECVLGERDKTTQSVTSRTALIVAHAQGKSFEVAEKQLKAIYQKRSDFVHQAKSIEAGDVHKAEEICGLVYFAAMRSCLAAPRAEKWHSRWGDLLDHIWSCQKLGIAVSKEILVECGLRPHEPSEGETIQ